MIVDVMYHHYWFTGEDIDDEPEFSADLGAIEAVRGRAVVSTFTESGPVILRVLVGEYLPGADEESWRAEWERVTEIVLDAREPLQVCSWEYAPSDPPSGHVVGLGRHHLRLYARGRAKVERDHYVETPLEEHLVLIWPADAPARPAGEGPRWTEVTGEPLSAPADGEARSGYGPVKVPDGYFELRWQGTTPASVPDRGRAALIPADGVVTVAVGHSGLADAMVEVSEFTPEDHDWHADEILECDIDTARPLRLLDGTGQPPRGMPDPLTRAPGRWGVRLYARYREPEYGPILLIWPWGAPTKDEADRARYGDYESYDDGEVVDADYLPGAEVATFSIMIADDVDDGDFLTWLRFLEQMPRNLWP